jgi:hypothetical protein
MLKDKILKINRLRHICIDLCIRALIKTIELRCSNRDSPQLNIPMTFLYLSQDSIFSSLLSLLVTPQILLSMDVGAYAAISSKTEPRIRGNVRGCVLDHYVFGTVF